MQLTTELQSITISTLLRESIITKENFSTNLDCHFKNKSSHYDYFNPLGNILEVRG